MRVALYARVSTADKGQDPDTQLIPLREFAAAQDWKISREYVDRASAIDHKSRVAWRRLLDDASRRVIDLVLVWRMDRAFRSVLDAAQTLERLRGWKVGLRSYAEPWLDTTSAFGEVMFHITCAYAQLERSMISERVKAGLDRARRQGKRIGRPRLLIKGWPSIRSRIEAGDLTWDQAADAADCSRSTLARMLRAR